MLMKLKIFMPLLILAQGCSAIADSNPVSQRLWTLPPGAHFEALSERPNERLGIYWWCLHNPAFPGHAYTRFSLLDADAKLLESGEVPGHHFASNGIAREDWNARGQHAFLPQCAGTSSNFLRLKRGESYRVLRILPRFNNGTLQDLRFSPDGECLYVLGPSKLWIIGAQTGRLVRVVKPRWGKKWSDENAVLSPDCHKVLGMRGKMALFSTRSGALLRRFGTKVETLLGHCGGLEAKVYFSQNGKFAIASMQDINDYEAWVYPAQGGALCWHGRTPYSILETAGGHFFLDTPRLDEHGAVSTILRRWRDGRIGWHLGLNFNYSDLWLGPHLVFARDGHWIYFTRSNSVWRVAMPKFSLAKGWNNHP